MASITILLRDKPTKNGYPIIIKIIKDRKPSIITVGHIPELNLWDEEKKRVKKSHPNSARLNNMIAARLAEVTDKGLDLETRNRKVSAKAIRTAFKGAKEGTFFKQAEIYLQLLEKSGKHNRHSSDKPRIKYFRKFLGGGDIQFSEIDAALLERFGVWLMSERNCSKTTIANYYRVIRSVFKQAISGKLADKNDNPFGRDGILIKQGDSNKIGLEIADVIAIEQADVTGQAHHARNLWLFAFYFAGMRMSDVLRLKWSDFQNGRLYYVMGKNEKSGSLIVPDKAQAIMEQYRRDNPVHDLVFPDLEKLPDLSDGFSVQRYIKTRIRANNEYLQEVLESAGIARRVTSHISRHSYGNIAGDQVPLEQLQKQYRHTTPMTTINYQQNHIHKASDTSLLKVVNFQVGQTPDIETMLNALEREVSRKDNRRNAQLIERLSGLLTKAISV